MLRYVVLFLLFISPLSANTRLFDVLLFCDELDLLELRLREHDSVVDYFIIVEGKKTFTDEKKPLFFKKNKKRFERWENKIIYLVISDFPNCNSAWEKEYYTRNFAMKTLKKMCSPDDIILHSDCDEIVSTDVLKSFKESNDHSPHCIQMDFYYYNFNWKKQMKWERAYVAKYQEVKQKGLLGMRDIAGTSFPIIANAGWHLSYFMTPQGIAKKIKSFSHTEFNKPPYTDLDWIQTAINSGTDLFGRGGADDCVRSLQDDKLPKHIDILPAMFQRDPQ